MTVLFGQVASFSQTLLCICEIVPVFGVRGEGEHLRRHPHEADSDGSARAHQGCLVGESLLVLLVPLDVVSRKDCD